MARIVSALLPSGAVDPAAIAEAAALLASGRLVALPTETVYGLAANALDVAAVRSIFAAKGRPAFNPLITHVLDTAHARTLAKVWPDAAEQLAKAFWPGPLSLIVPKADAVPDEVTAGLPAVALRVPAHPVIRAVIQRSGLALAAPSANRSNAISPTTAAHVAASLGDRVDLILDGGPCAFGIESTVVDLTGPEPRVLRPGGISSAQLAAVIGPLGVAPEPHAGAARASPGQMERHYAPDAATMLVPGNALAATMGTLPSTARVAGIAVDTPAPPDTRIASWERLGQHETSYARDLYAALHRADASGATHILIEQVPATAAWDAVRDRLRRAATKE